MPQPNDLVHGRHRIVRHIAGGGFGAVYEATDESLHQRVALKLSHRIVVADPNEMAMVRKAFEHEAQILARLRNPGLPRVTHYFTDGDAQYLVMDYIPGGNMAEALHSRRGQPFPPTDVLRWADQLLDILDYLHGEGIVHRDIKPANMKLTRQRRREQMVLLDFGLAKGQLGNAPIFDMLEYDTLESDPWEFAHEPPEQLQLPQVLGVGDRGTDGRSDLFSLAMTLYELVTGQRPPSAGERVLAMRIGGEDDPLRPPHLLVPAVPPALSDALLAALVLPKDHRTPDAATMRAALPAPGAPPPPIPPKGELETRREKLTWQEQRRRLDAAMPASPPLRAPESPLPSLASPPRYATLIGASIAVVLLLIIGVILTWMLGWF